MSLKTDYKNDIYTGKRKYQVAQNEDGTVSLDDVTQYVREGDVFSADDINATNKAINETDKDNSEFRESIVSQVEKVENTVESLTGGILLNLPASGWSSTAPFTLEVAVPGLKENDQPTYGLRLIGTLSDVTVEAQRLAWGHVDRIASGNGKATAYCYSKKPGTSIAIVARGVVNNG